MSLKANPSKAECFRRHVGVPYVLLACVQGGQADADSPYCSLASLVADICVADQMNSMNGCEAHNALCGDGTVVQQCLEPGAAPNVPTTFLTKANIDVRRAAEAVCVGRVPWQAMAYRNCGGKAYGPDATALRWRCGWPGAVGN